jgi:long-subunit acyl-CoA synthetase (AMP-forming)
MTLNWAIHRLNGVSSPANAAYNADELRHQLTNSGSRVLFTVMPLLQTALDAAAKSNIPRKHVYICEMPNDPPLPKEFKTLSQLIKEGESLPELEPIKWEKGQGERQTAFLCYSSGTSGLPVSFLLQIARALA